LFCKLVVSGTNGREERMQRGDLKFIPIREVGKHLIYKHEENNWYAEKNSCACSLVPVRPFNVTEIKANDSGM